MSGKVSSTINADDMASVELLENKRFSHIESYRVMTANRILFTRQKNGAERIAPCSTFAIPRFNSQDSAAPVSPTQAARDRLFG